MPRLLQRNYNGSLEFTAYSGQYARTSSNASLSPAAGSFTLAWWGKANQPNAGNYSIAQFASTYTNGWAIFLNLTSKFNIYCKSINIVATTDNVYYTQGEWARWVLVANATGPSVQMYKNGVLILNKSVSSWGSMTTPDLLSLGQGPDAPGGCMPYSISDFVYDVGGIWTAAQILLDYTNNIQPINTVIHRWSLNECVGLTAAYSGNSTNLPLTLTAATFSANSPMKLRNNARQLSGSLYHGLTASSTSHSANTTLSNGTGSCTIAWWGKFSDTPFNSGTRTIFEISSYSVPATCLLIFAYSFNGMSYLYAYPAGGSGNIVNTDNIIIANDPYFHRWVITLDYTNSKIRVYKDGALVLSKATSAWNVNSNASFTIGGGSFASAINMNVSDLVYDVVNSWTDAQVLTDYTNNIQPVSSNQHRWLMNEGTGTIAVDSGTTVNPMNLTLNGSSGFSSDSPVKIRNVAKQYGGCLVLPTTGTASKAASSANASLCPTNNSFSVAFWMQSTQIISNGNTTCTLLWCANTTYTDGWAVFHTAGGTLGTYVGSGTPWYTGQIPDMSWHRYVMTHASNKTVSLYRDGLLIFSGSLGSLWNLTSPATMIIGSQQFNNDCANISDVIYDIGNAWTAAQVLTEYQKGVVPVSSNQHRYLLNEGYGSTAIDSGTTATPLNLALSGGALFNPLSPSKVRGNIQNFWFNSEITNIAPWTPGGVTNINYVGTMPTTLPAPTTAIQYTDDNSTGYHATGTVTANGLLDNQNVIVSVYGKNISGSGWVFLRCQAGFQFFDLINTVVGTTISATPTSAGIVDVGNGWKRFWVLTQPYGGGICVPSLYLGNGNGTNTYAGTSSNSTAFTGVQIEVVNNGQTTPSAYVKTTYSLSSYGLKYFGQNILKYSEDLSKSNWAKTGCSINGTTDIVEDGALNGHRVYQGVSAEVTLSVLSISAYASVRAGIRIFFAIQMNDSGGTFARFDIVNGLIDVNGGSVISSKIVSEGGGWFGCYAIISAPTTSPNISFSALQGSSGSGTYTGSNGSTALSIRKIQVVQGAGFIGDYIKTTSAPYNPAGAPRLLNS